MRTTDGIRFAFRALTGYRVRTLLMLLAMSIGVAAVVVLTSLGEGARRYVTGEFAALGTNLLIVIPGRNETTGGAPPLGGLTPRELTPEDAEALTRSRSIRRVAPINVGEAPVSSGSLSRDAMIMGTNHEMRPIRHLELDAGTFLPELPVGAASSVAVVGRTLARELFGARSPIGEWIRIGDRRFRVIGVVGQHGQSFGVNMDETVMVPVASAQSLFNTSSLFRIFIEAAGRDEIEAARAATIRIISERHEGEEDITVISQDSVLASFDKIFTALTLTVGGIAAISLIVAGILVMNVMLVAVAQRTNEIGLLRALGASARRVLLLFLTEAALLSLLGALLGTALGMGGSWLIGKLFPALPLQPPVWAVAAAILIALGTGTVFAVVPARRAARLDPVEALQHR